MLLDQGNAQAVIGRRRLELAVKTDAKAFAQREPPGAIDARAPGRMKNQLHAAGLVEETLGDNLILRRDSAEYLQRVGNVTNDLLGGTLRHGDLIHQPLCRPSALRQKLRHGFAQVGYGRGQLECARRGLAEPKWD